MVARHLRWRRPSFVAHHLASTGTDEWRLATLWACPQIYSGGSHPLSEELQAWILKSYWFFLLPCIYPWLPAILWYLWLQYQQEIWVLSVNEILYLRVCYTSVVINSFICSLNLDAFIKHSADIKHHDVSIVYHCRLWDVEILFLSAFISLLMVSPSTSEEKNCYIWCDTHIIIHDLAGFSLSYYFWQILQRYYKELLYLWFI